MDWLYTLYIKYQRRIPIMSSALWILLARAVHILGGVAWAGSVFMTASVILPLAARHGHEGFGQWVGMIGRRMGPVSGIAALLTILSGIYLMAVLHEGDRSIGGIVLLSGAVAALLSFLSGFFIGRPAGLKLAKLSEQLGQSGTPSAEIAQQIASLRARTAVSTRITTALLGLAVLAMAVFRYAAAIG
jgi:uncharacterized membrane protein